MKPRIGFIYSSVDGQTRKISFFLADRLRENGFNSEVYSIDDFQEPISNFDMLVVGASIRYGKHNSLISEFINNQLQELIKIPSAFFSVNLVARKKEKNSPETNPYLIKFLNSIEWKPDLLGVFAGKLDYRAYSFWDRVLIKAIMKITNGPTKTDTPIEYTDWKRVAIFGKNIATITSEKSQILYHQ